MSSVTHSNNIAARMGRWSASHWKTAVFGWLVFAVGALMVGQSLGTRQLDPQKAGSGESGHVQAVLADEWKQPPSEVVLVQSRHGSAQDPSFHRAVDDLVTRLRSMK